MAIGKLLLFFIVFYILSAAEAVADGILGENGVAGVAAHARAHRPSCPNEAAARLRRHSRLGHRLAAPRRLAATGSSSDSIEKSSESSRNALQPTAQTLSRSSSMVVMAPDVLATLCTNQSNAE